MNALFTFTIGPVKSFVENGRKMQDLYAGSYILSKITKHAIEYIKTLQKKEHMEISIVFPNVQIQEMDQSDNLPNRLVAKINNFNVDRDEKMALDLENCVKEYYKILYDVVLEQIFENQEDRENLRIEAEQQLENFLEIYWLFVEYDGSKKEYKEAYQELFCKLHEIKSIRPFKQTDEEWGRKCSLHPEYNAIFVRKTDGELPHNSNKQHIVDLDIDMADDESRRKLKAGEALSAVALFKRLDKKSESMDSVRYIVLKNCLEWEKKSEMFNSHISKNAKTSLDRTNIADAFYDLYNEIEPSMDEYSEKPIDAAKKLYDIVVKQEKVRPSSYYAMIKFDGDSMGEKYSKISSEKIHQQLSDNICEFAKQAKEEINKKGRCIYAGGEDVLGFLPLNELWQTLRILHENFSSTLKDKLNSDSDLAFTFSAGIVVAHLMQPLKDVMQQVDKAEKLAKSVEGKNAFAITVMKRGGESRTVSHKFEQYEALNAINEAIVSLKDKEYSKALIFDCCKVLGKLTKEVSKEMVKELIHQIILQKIPKDRDKAQKIQAAIFKLYEQNSDLPIFLDTLDIISFLAREVNYHDI